MPSNLKDRTLRVFGTLLLATIALFIANHPIPQTLLTEYVPYIWRLKPSILEGSPFFIAYLTTLVVVFISFFPVFKPKPRRILDTVLIVQKRVFISGFMLATIGYANYTYRLPRSTLILLTAILFLLLPFWFVYIGGGPKMSHIQPLLVGNDKEKMQEILEKSGLNFIGYVSPTPTNNRIVDGGIKTENKQQKQTLDGLEWLGTFTRLEDLIVKHNVDSVVLAFNSSDRSDFFGVLDTCYRLGVDVKTHRKNGDNVLTEKPDIENGNIVDVELEPLDPQDYLLKRIFDVCFSGFGLLFLSPIILVIALSIKLDSKGPILYRQERTSEFGDIFTVYKFRSMVVDAEKETGAKLSDEDRGDMDPRVTRVGGFLRKTHLDEIPQLWSILTGDMSVVGPRPERPELDREMESNVVEWRKRWFIKPGLTGLAQINDATGFEPDKKLRLDLQYIQNQSFWFDIKIVIRQIWKVLTDIYKTIKQNNLGLEDRDD